MTHTHPFGTILGGQGRHPDTLDIRLMVIAPHPGYEDAVKVVIIADPGWSLSSYHPVGAISFADIDSWDVVDE